MDKLQFSMSDVNINSSHPNKMYITGCVSTVGEASESAPCGSDGKQVIISKQAADANVNSFVGTPVNCSYSDWFPEDCMTGHDARNTIGCIDSAWVDGNKLMAKIVVWKQNFPDIAYMIFNAQEALGFSIEANITDWTDSDEYETIDGFTGTGCAILWKKCAAFGDATYIKELVAQAAKLKHSSGKGKEDVEMTKEEMDKIVAGVSASVEAAVDKKFKELKVDELKASVDDVKEAQAKFSEQFKAKEEIETEKVVEAKEAKAEASESDKVAKLQAMVDELNAKIEAMKDIPAPKADGGNPEISASKEDYAEEIKKIDASSMSSLQRMKAKAALAEKAVADKTDVSKSYKRL